MTWRSNACRVLEEGGAAAVAECADGGGGHAPRGAVVGGRGLHSSTSQLNLSRCRHWQTDTNYRVSQRLLTLVELKK